MIIAYLGSTTDERDRLISTICCHIVRAGIGRHRDICLAVSGEDRILDWDGVRRVASFSDDMDICGSAGDPQFRFENEAFVGGKDRSNAKRGSEKTSQRSKGIGEGPLTCG